MTVVHPHPHPRTMCTVQITNPEVAKKFGQKVYVVDWDDRITGETWNVLASRGVKPEDGYAVIAAQYQAPISPGQTLDVVRCHDLTTGELILLHDDWIS